MQIVFKICNNTKSSICPTWSTLVEGDEQPAPLLSYLVHEGKHCLF